MEVVSVRSSNISTRGIEIESWADRQPRCELLELGHLHHLLVIYLSNLNLSGHDNIYWLNSLLNRARDHMKVWQAGDNDHDQTWKRIMFLEIMFLFLLASITCISWITNVFNIWFENGYIELNLHLWIYRKCILMFVLQFHSLIKNTSGIILRFSSSWELLSSY